jgi:glycosyltransferase involved in cell wall biosynthesis
MSDGHHQPRRRLYFSSERHRDMHRQIGTAHYSYGIVAGRFARMLAHENYDVVPVAMPEKFKRVQDLEKDCGNGRPIHLTFRSSENLRPIPFAYNICHFAWEFDVLKDRALVSEPISANQRHMLSLMDEIWVPARMTAEVLRRYGLENVHVVPTPVCGTQLPTRLSRQQALDIIGLTGAVPMLLSSGMTSGQGVLLTQYTTRALADLPPFAQESKDVKIFLNVCNPGDLRKNLLNLIDGFLMATKGREGDILIVKLAAPAAEEFFENRLLDHIRPRFNGPFAVSHPRIAFVSDYLAEAQMGALYSLADFYVSPSHCEGHNLPLLEAMAHGIAAISTRNTAMEDYIDEDNAVVIAERRFLGAIPQMASESAGVSPLTSIADRFDIARAIRAALAMTPKDYNARVSRGRAMVGERYGEATAMRLVAERLHEIAARAGSNALAS